MNPHFDLDLKEGQIYEQKLKKILSCKIEVKTDRMSHETGNVAVEVAYKGRPSGIMTTHARVWCQWLQKERRIILIPVDELKKLIKGRKTIFGGDDGNSELVLLGKHELVDMFCF